MLFWIDFDSEEALYMQLRNQVILAIAMEEVREGDALPSVRQLADDIGINMHTVNKAYAVLKQEGFLKLDRRHGAVIALDVDKIRALEELEGDMKVVLAKAICKDISREEAHALVDRIYDGYRRIR
ncbi:MAG: GntR family transcriptional regulator [Lachnospiraceae bacterium]|nr:GntR family transcriptional regulator [Lachnospiraceae bacterium]